MTEREALKLTLAALKQIDAAMPFPVAKLAIMEAEKALAQPEQVCRDDGRCQYAIDHGAEGLGHCPKGKCVMPAQSEQERPQNCGTGYCSCIECVME